MTQAEEHHEAAVAPPAAPEQAAWLDRFEAETTQRRQRLRGVEVLWSWGRLFTFFGAFLVWWPLHGQAGVALLANGALLAAFGWCVSRHRPARVRREQADHLLQTVAETRQRLDGALVAIRSARRPTDPEAPAALLDELRKTDQVHASRAEDESDPSSGRTWALSPQERDDLDLYAEPIGVFGLLHRGSSVMAARRLRDWLEHPLIDRTAIEARQASVRWLDEHAEQRLRVLAAAVPLREQDADVDRLVQLLRNATPMPQRGTVIFMRAWSVPSVLFTAFALVQVARGSYNWGWLWLGLLGFNGLLYAQVMGLLKRHLRPWIRRRLVIGKIVGALYAARSPLPQETELAPRRAVLVAATGQVDQRFNGDETSRFFENR